MHIVPYDRNTSNCTVGVRRFIVYRVFNYPTDPTFLRATNRPSSKARKWMAELERSGLCGSYTTALRKNAIWAFRRCQVFFDKNRIYWKNWIFSPKIFRQFFTQFNLKYLKISRKNMHECCQKYLSKEIWQLSNVCTAFFLSTAV